MPQMNVSKFKEQCLTLLEELGPDGLVITKRGRPIAKVMPITQECAGLIGSLKGRLKPKGNLLTTGLRWDAKS